MPRAVERVDVEATLLLGGVIEPCAGEDDLCLVEEFRRAWYDRMDELARVEDKQVELARTLGYDPGAVTFVDHGEAVVGNVEGTRVGQWESDSALTADLATLQELPGWLDGWEQLSAAARRQLMTGLRVFLDRCPSCGGNVSLGQEVKQSCCRSHEVVVARCQACERPMLEQPYDPGTHA